MSSFKLKKVALVVLAAFGAGGAIAADATVDSDFVVSEGKSQEYGNLTIESGTFKNFGTTSAAQVEVMGSGRFINEEKGSFKVAGGFADSTGSFVNKGTLEVGKLTLSGWGNSNGAGFGGKIQASEAIVLTLTGYENKVSDNLVLSTPYLEIRNDGVKPSGVQFTNQAQIANVGEVAINSYGGKTGITVAPGQSLHFNKVTLNAVNDKDDARIEVHEGGTVEIDKLSGDGDKSLIQTNAGATATVHDITVEQGGRVVFQTNASGKDNLPEGQDQSGTFNISNVYVNDGARFEISVSSDPHAYVVAKDLTITLASGARADFGGWKEEAVNSWDPARIHLKADTLTVNVLDTDNLPSVYLSGVEGNTDVGSLSVVATGSNNSGDAAADLQKLSGVVKTNTKTADDGSNESVSVTAETIKDITLTQEANDIYDGATASVDETGAVTAIQSTGNVNIDGIAGIASTGFLLWRDEMTSLNRRLDDLRGSSAHDNGLWVRAYNSRSEYGARNITSKYTAIQVGYDRQISNQFWLGGAFSYTDGDHEVAQGSADNSLAAFTLYGTWMNDSGLFVDVTGKYGRIDNDFDINLGSDQGVSSGDYDTNAWGLSVQAGWRWQPNMFFVEPQVELMYGRMSSVDYITSTGLTVDHDAVDSLIGRAGFRIGVDYPDNLGRIYLRASVLHDWKGEADYTFTKGAISRYETDDLSGTWYEVGVGANFNVTDNLHIIGDLQTSHGGEVDTDYRVNLVARYSF